jgi:hypothetical protein
MLADKAVVLFPDYMANRGHEFERLGTSLNSKAPPNYNQLQLSDLTAAPYARARRGQRLLHRYVGCIADILTWIANTVGKRPFDRGRSAMSVCARERPPN